MTPVLDAFMAYGKPQGLQRGRGGFLRSADDAPYVTDPSGEVCKTGDRKGEVKRLKYGSPSNRGREIENDAGLVKYKQRLSLAGIGMDPTLADACRELANLPVGSPEFNSAADAIAVEADRLTRSSLAADRGTHGHLICESFDRGDTSMAHLFATGVAVGLDEKTQVDVSNAWGFMVQFNGLEILAIEASCVDDKWRLAGTLDRIVRLTRPLTFVKPGGELVTIPADTVLVLDIKFGKTRKAHPIQIASYAQSVPYDTTAETRAAWPWAINQTHALIAHGDFGDESRPVSIELVWVDLVAGREHGGETVVQAKAWAARGDIFSVSQIVEDEAGRAAPSPASSLTFNDLIPRQGLPQHVLDEMGVDLLNDQRRQSYEKWEANNGARDRDGDSAWDVAAVQSDGAAGNPPTAHHIDGAGDDRGHPLIQIVEGEAANVASAGPGPAPSTPSSAGVPDPSAPLTVGEEAGAAAGHSPTSPPCPNPRCESGYIVDNFDPGLMPCPTCSPVSAVSARLALVDARGQLCATPDEGADLSDGEFDELWDRLRKEFDQLPPAAKAWRSELAQRAKQRGVCFMAQTVRSERTYWINQAVVSLAITEWANDDILRELLAHIIGDVALFPGVEPGHALGSLNATEAERFARHVQACLVGPKDPA